MRPGLRSTQLASRLATQAQSEAQAKKLGMWGGSASFPAISSLLEICEAPVDAGRRTEELLSIAIIVFPHSLPKLSWGLLSFFLLPG